MSAASPGMSGITHLLATVSGPLVQDSGFEHGTLGARVAMGLVVALVVIACVCIHYEALRLMSIELPKVPFPHLKIAAVIIGLLVAHTIELWVFAFVFSIVDGRWEFGELLVDHPGYVTALEGDLFDYAYYSVSCYTTIGFGDVTPTGPLRLMTGMEGLLGLVLIGWSASFTYLVMQRYWKDD